MRICRVSQTYPTKLQNGIGLHAFHTSNLIQEPTLILTRQTAEPLLESAPHVQVRMFRYMQFPFPQSSRSVLRFALAMLSYFLGQFEFLIKAAPSVLKFAPEIVHLQSPHAIPIGIFAKLFCKSRLVITFHGSDFKRVAKLPFYFPLLRAADRIFYVSDAMRPVLERHFPAEKLVQTNSGVDLLTFSADPGTPREKLLLSVGNLRWQKDYPTLLSALKIVFASHSDYAAVIIGEGPDRAALEKRAAELGISSKVRFLGQQPSTSVRDSMSKARLFILSSSTEGMPKVLLEAMACRLPIVGTDVGAVREVTSNCGWVAPKQDPDALASKIIELLNDDSSWKRFSENGPSSAARFSWEMAAQKIHDEFRSLVNSRSGSSTENRDLSIQQGAGCGDRQ